MPDAFTNQDELHMRRALALARKGQGRVEPNPMVGCVLVRGRRVVGEGFHRRFGGPHAEINALRAAGAKARAATCYVTLEPCCHHGKTPPCTDALIQSRVSRVIVAMRDPFPQVRGRGFRLLRKAGITVTSGLLEAESAALNAPYLKLQRERRPWVILKWAQSLDGKIATRTGDSKWISCEKSRVLAHRIRGRMDAVVVGVGTVIADDPMLTCRDARTYRQATRVVLDPKLRTPQKAALICSADQVPTIIVTDRHKFAGAKASRLKKRGAEIIGVHSTSKGLDLRDLLDELGRRSMTNIMVEGGGKTLGAFFDQQLADEAVVFVAPKLIGGADAISPLAGLGSASMHDIPLIRDIQVRRAGQDHVYRFRFDR